MDGLQKTTGHGDPAVPWCDCGCKVTPSRDGRHPDGVIVVDVVVVEAMRGMMEKG
jgi:hypothetical protein